MWSLREIACRRSLTLASALTLSWGTPATAQQTPISELAGIELVTLQPEDLLLGRIDAAVLLMTSLDQRGAAVRSMRQEMEGTLQQLRGSRPQGEGRQRWDLERRFLAARIDAAEAKLQFYLAQRQLLRAQIGTYEREAELTRTLAQVAGVGAGAERARLVGELSFLEQAVLDGLGVIGNREGVVAQRRRDFVDRQTRVVEIRRELASLRPE